MFCSCKLVPEVDLGVDVADQLGRGQCSQAGQGGGDANPGQEDGDQLQTDPDQAHRHVEEILGELISDIFHKQETSLIDAEIGENVRKVEKKNVVDMKCSGENRIDQEENEKIDLNDLFLATNENDHDILNQEVVEESVKSCEEGGMIPQSEAVIYSSLTKQQLKRTGILTALAIGLHNIPEGVATYIG